LSFFKFKKVSHTRGKKGAQGEPHPRQKNAAINILVSHTFDNKKKHCVIS
tara:strand:+ start:3847 stop:3996 length:150 start_codon:yes stop_codon:yes gene_type:complete